MRAKHVLRQTEYMFKPASTRNLPLPSPARPASSRQVTALIPPITSEPSLRLSVFKRRNHRSRMLLKTGLSSELDQENHLCYLPRERAASSWSQLFLLE